MSDYYIQYRMNSNEEQPSFDEFVLLGLATQPTRLAEGLIQIIKGGFYCISIQQKMMCISILLFGIGGFQAALGQTFTYKQIIKGEDSIRKLMIHKTKNGFRVNVINPNGGESSSEMDQSGSFFKMEL